MVTTKNRIERSLSTQSRQPRPSRPRRTDAACMTRMVFIRREFEDSYPELIFIAENAHDAELFAKGLDAAKQITDADEVDVFTGSTLRLGELQLQGE
jgi:hypothetical protein